MKIYDPSAAPRRRKCRGSEAERKDACAMSNAPTQIITSAYYECVGEPKVVAGVPQDCRREIPHRLLRWTWPRFIQLRTAKTGLPQAA